ncbi:MAG: endolytic transglycosylase MltG [Patescibacteria group bacterium]|nr:endolytic transglycosylase MltG [Patescibacteria group bacterium]
MIRKKNKKYLQAILLAVIIVFLAGFFYWQYNLLPVNPLDKSTKNFTVTQGESVRSVARSLQNKGLIKNWMVFLFQVKLFSKEEQIQAGEFNLSPSWSLNQITKVLGHGTFDVTVTVPEGFRNEEIAKRLETETGISARAFLLSSREGYMFPDTYTFAKNSSAQFMANLMEQTFSKKITAINSEALAPGKKFSGLTLNQLVVLASLVEREAKHKQDRPIVAGILLKRLQNDWPLEVDASIQFALGYDIAQKTWWRNNLTQEELAVNSLYNTRKNKGLPPGPICNPGSDSLRAVFYPQETSYWFYLSDKNGNMHYAKTLEEHNANVQKYIF